MYSSFFNLTENPFGETPNTRFFFNSASHLKAAEDLRAHVESGKGFGILTGEVGTGKTLLSRLILKELHTTANTALILFPSLSPVELIAAVAEEFRLCNDLTGQQRMKLYVDRLYQFLLHSASAGRKTVLVIDEAHRLPIETLEVIRLLNNLETEREKLLQILLVGQPELLDTLDREEIRQLTQRISLQTSLSALTLSETDAYISHRLYRAGEAPLVRFDMTAVNWIWQRSGGNPRKINLLC
ncbi:MAG: AAA family ATPase, partial [Bdellovibrionales bacterium]|nr:AAA family ATPase [Bdellovibrionales bacterium]